MSVVWKYDKTGSTKFMFLQEAATSDGLRVAPVLMFSGFQPTALFPCS